MKHGYSEKLTVRVPGTGTAPVRKMKYGKAYPVRRVEWVRLRYGKGTRMGTFCGTFGVFLKPLKL